MHPRNYKVRIHNLSLKKTVFLESNTAYNQIRIKYTRYLERLGYVLSRSGGTNSSNVKMYTYYYKAHFTNRAEFNDTWKKYGSRYTRYNTKQRPTSPNPHIVMVEIIRFNHKHAPK